MYSTLTYWKKGNKKELHSSDIISNSSRYRIQILIPIPKFNLIYSCENTISMWHKRHEYIYWIEHSLLLKMAGIEQLLNWKHSQFKATQFYGFALSGMSFLWFWCVSMTQKFRYFHLFLGELTKKVIFSKEGIKNVASYRSVLEIVNSVNYTLDRIMSGKQSLNNCIGPECHRCCCFL